MYNRILDFSSIMIFILFLCCILFENVNSTLVLNETFQDISNTWMVHRDGHTGVIETVDSTVLFSDPNHPKSKYLFTNITQCGEGHCFRAELAYGEPKNIAKSRAKLIPNSNLEYWLGTSIYIPSTWSYKQTNKNVYSVVYHLQLHGGDNLGNKPVLGLKQVNDYFVIGICGNTGPNMEQVCYDQKVGKWVVGEWVDFVIHSKLAYGNPDGFVEVWRNGQLMMNVSNLLTTVDEVKPPYLILGSYQFNWKVNQTEDIGYDWIACYHKAIRLGLGDSSYSEVYTGNGQPCGDYCLPESVPLAKPEQLKYLWAVVPLSLIIIFTIILCISRCELKNRLAFIASEKERAEKERQAQAAGQGSLFRATILSFKQFVNQKTLQKETERPIQTKAQHWYEVLKYASMTRTIIWTIFSMFMVLLVCAVALMAYGSPYLSTYTFLLTGVIPSKNFAEWDILQVTMIVISGTMTAIYFIPLFYLRHDFDAGRKWVNNPQFLKRIGVVIPCHKSAKEIGEVLRRCLKYFPAENVVVCDNGNFEFPPDNTFEVVKKVDPHVRYIYIQQGHKTRALWTGAHRLPSHVEYIIHLDDDTHFDEDHMVFDESHFDEKHVIAVAFLRSCYPHNMVTRLTDFWYKITDHFHATQAKIATRCFVPGPAGMWRRDKFLEIFGKHPSLPFGEDIFGGYTTLNSGYAIRAETRCMVRTFAPDIFLPWFVNPLTARVQGYGASSLWKQRAHRWTVSAFRISGKSLYSFFTYDTKLGFFSNIAFRLYRFREYKLILTQLLFVPFLLAYIARGLYAEFLVMKALLFVLPLTRNIYINYICWRNQPDLQVPWYVVALSPFYNYFLIICAIHGRWKCILWYLPWVAPNHGMLQKCRPKSLKTVPTVAYTNKITLGSPEEMEDGSLTSWWKESMNLADTTISLTDEEQMESHSDQDIHVTSFSNFHLSSRMQHVYKGNDLYSFELFHSPLGFSRIIDYYQVKAKRKYFIFPEGEDELDMLETQSQDTLPGDIEEGQLEHFQLSTNPNELGEVILSPGKMTVPSGSHDDLPRGLSIYSFGSSDSLSSEEDSSSPNTRRNSQQQHRSRILSLLSNADATEAHQNHLFPSLFDVYSSEAIAKKPDKPYESFPRLPKIKIGKAPLPPHELANEWNDIEDHKALQFQYFSPQQ